MSWAGPRPTHSSQQPTKLPSPPSDKSQVPISIPREIPIPLSLIEHLHNFKYEYPSPFHPYTNSKTGSSIPQATREQVDRYNALQELFWDPIIHQIYNPPDQHDIDISSKK